MEKTKITYAIEEYSKSGVVNSQGCRSIWFENLGEVDCKLDGVLSLDVDDPIRAFKNTNKDEVISKNFTLTFDPASTNPLKKIVVIKEFVL